MCTRAKQITVNVGYVIYCNILNYLNLNRFHSFKPYLAFTSIYITYCFPLNISAPTYF